MALDRHTNHEVSVLFVCMGNICRSPTAEGVFRQRLAAQPWAARVRVDSAGTHGDYHAGEPPDPRTRSAARARGYDLDGLRARKVTEEDLRRFDYILAMDEDNLWRLQALAGADPALRGKLALMMDHASQLGVREVPDPYYGGPQGFEHVLDLLEAAADGLLEALQLHHFSNR